MFRSKTRRARKYSESAVIGSDQFKPSPSHSQAVATHSSKPIASSAFDEMLRSNQTIYIGSMREAQSPMSYNSSEIVYSSIPLSAAKPNRPSR
ncbi:hypothetical protein MJO29_012715 [Puccinia striiformis f. sp. tritici]|nr:hypothetical protein MJO29_012715 [Puccinia striiformis f. sp. tritici]KAI9606624.1 hypothetical protein H4Q26_006160 [Puccinia striiformis f. sp. tritici PST-130]